MKPQVDAKIKLTLPVGPGELTPVAVDAKITAIYEDGFHGIAGTEPKVIKEGKTDKKVSYNVDAEVLDGTKYKYVSYAEEFKCWHWCWPKAEDNRALEVKEEAPKHTPKHAPKHHTAKKK